MDLKTDRVEKTTQEKIDNEKKSNEKTELEKYAPDLFKQQSTDAFKAQQKQIDVETKKLEDSLFVQSDKKDTAMKNIQEELFSKNYTTGTANTASLDTNPIDPFSKKVIIALSSLVFGICCGIYAVIKKIWE
jgi:type VII secretion protein EssA